MTDKQKVPYEKKATKDKDREHKQIVELTKLGYYTLEDGTKSTDPENAKLLKVKKKLLRSKSSESSKSEKLDKKPILKTKSARPKVVETAKPEGRPTRKKSEMKVTEPAKTQRDRYPVRGKSLPKKLEESKGIDRAKSLTK